MKVVCYYRYSTDNKGQVDNSEARQQESVENVVARNGWHIVKSVSDKAVSGADDKPELMSLKEDVESGRLKVDVIAIDSLSRLSRRSMMDIHHDVKWIEDAGIKLSIANKNSGIPFGIVELSDDLSHMVDAWQNNQYLKKLSREVKNGMVTKFRAGKLGWIGRAPYGYDLNRKLDLATTIKANEDLSIITEVFDTFLKTNNVRQCCEVVAKTKQYKEHPDKYPNATTVKNILRNSIYAGIRTFGVRGVGKFNTASGHNRKWVAENPLVQCSDYIEYKAVGYKPAITLEQYKEVQGILDRNQKEFRKHPTRHKHTYSGMMRCSHCGGAMTASKYTNKKTKKKKTRYVCPNSQTNRTDKCKEKESPSSKLITTAEFEKLLVHQFGITFMDVDTHVINIETLMNKMRERSLAAGDNVDLDLDIQQERLNKLTEMFVETGSESIRLAIEKQAAKVDMIKERDVNKATEDILDYAKEQFQLTKGSDGYQRYLGLCYGAALKLIDIDDEIELLKRKVVSARLIRELFLGRSNITLAEADGTFAVEFLDDDDSDKCNIKRPADCLSILRDMNLSHIGVSFELGLRRGKASRVPVGLQFNFLVTSINYTDRG